MQPALSVNLPYFHQKVLHQMLSWEALNRPNFLKLQKIFKDEQNRLADNLDNQQYVDDLFSLKKKVVEESHVDQFTSPESQQEAADSESEEEQRDRVAQLDIQIVNY